MPNKFSLSALVLLVTVATAAAQFEGVVEMKMTMTDQGGAHQGDGTMKCAISKAGGRSEMNMRMSQMSLVMVMLAKSDTPNTVYRINDGNRTYTEIDVNKAQAMAAQGLDDDQYTVKKLGEEKILGYNTQHVLVTHKDTTNELWTAREFLDYGTFSKMQTRLGSRMGGDKGMAKALNDVGVDGMPLKSVASAGDGGKMTIEVTKAEKKLLPASTFEIPAGYTKSSGGMMDMMGGTSGPQADDARKKMDDALKNMSPEQREMMEKMMNQRIGGSQ
jgi:hypothetical protein